MACGDATIAILYAIFAGIFVAVNLESQDVGSVSDIKLAFYQRFESRPFKGDKTILDVQSPSDLFEWLQTVFLSATFGEQARLGDSSGFCIDADTCSVNEGHCDSDSTCDVGLKCGETAFRSRGVIVNGNYWEMDELTEWCQVYGAPIDLSVRAQPCSNDSQDSNIPFCCWDYKSGDPAIFITEILPISVADSEGVAVLERSLGGNCPSHLPPDANCCADPDGETPFLNDTLREEKKLAGGRAAYVGSYNDLLLARLSIKRYKVQTNTVGQFSDERSDMYNKVLVGRGQGISFTSSTLYEDRETFDSSQRVGPIKAYVYTDSDGSYADAGGYVEWIDPLMGVDTAHIQLRRLKDDGFFDLRLATFTIDMMVFNGNVDLFAHVMWTFNFDGMGTCTKTTNIRSFNLNMFNSEIDRYRVRYTLEFILMAFVCFFIGLEFRKMYEYGFGGHFRQGGAWVDAASLCLCSMVLSLNLILHSDIIFQEFSFEALKDEDTRVRMYGIMESYAIRNEDQSYVVALNLFLVFVRAVVLVAQLQSNLGLMLTVLRIGFFNMLYFLSVFLMVLFGFVFFAHFTFGAIYAEMSTPLGTFKEIFVMLLGGPIYNQLAFADAYMAPVFFYTFYVLFYLVMKNVFISILMTGYDIAVFALERKLMDQPEQGLIRRILGDLRNDIYGPLPKLGVMVWRVMKICLVPIGAVFVDCLGFLMPKDNPLQKVGELMKRSGGGHDDSGEATPSSRPRAAGATNADAKNSFSNPKFLLEFCLMLAFMANFIQLMTFLTRGPASYRFAEATLGQITNVSWESSFPQRVITFADISSFEDVAVWSKEAVIGVRQAGLYSDTQCLYGNSSFTPHDGDCSGATTSEQTVQRVNKWNVGFMKSTFVRMTVQFSCYVDNPDPKFSSGYPRIRDPDLPTAPCSGTDCTSLSFNGDSIREDCLNVDGERLESWIERKGFRMLKAGKLGPKGLRGGYAVSLGASASTALESITELLQSGAFTRNALSMVFDFLTYNGNLDMFIHCQVQFSLLPTGRFDVASKAQAFPMNLIHGGGPEVSATRVASIVMFLVYVVLVAYFTLQVVLDLRAEKKRCAAEGKNAVYFLYSFFTRLWNISDTISLTLSIMAIVQIASYVTLPFREDYRFSIDGGGKYPVPNQDVKMYGMVGENHPGRLLEEDWFIFAMFEACETAYGTFLTIAALNSFFISIKVVKYVGNQGDVRVFSSTLATGTERMFWFTVIIGMVLVGFALCLTILFGTSVPSFRSPVSSATTLFKWVVGTYDINPLINFSPFLAVITFVVFMMFFYFIAVNMYLAAMMNTYSEELGKIDIRRKREQVEREKSIRIVEYKDERQLRNDLDIERDGADGKSGEVFVKIVKPGGIAEKHEVKVGHILFKVNGEREEWKREMDARQIMDGGIQKDPRDLKIRLTFKDPQKQAQGAMALTGLGGLMGGQKDGQDKEQATVKNFWKNHGAVQSVATKTEVEGMQDTKPEFEARREDDSDSEEDAEAVKDDDVDIAGDIEVKRKKVARVRTKRKLEQLLFSRWPDGMPRVDGEPALERGTGEYYAPFGGMDLGIADNETEMDVDHLRKEIENMQVTGEEVWMDCLMTAIEREDEGQCLVTEVLRTAEMHEVDAQRQGSEALRGSKPVVRFYENVEMFVEYLEYKARKKYYTCLQNESEWRRDAIQKQNHVLHDYASELESKFSEIMQQINSFKTKKQQLMAKMALLLDKKEYIHVFPEERKKEDALVGAQKPHMARLTYPWPHMSQSVAQQ
eukprot:TRINITY_DN91784_c0_g1_i1.p1 TRINITY_DN91784_c0_g1~~TRINITY_DN91784_c0_g1_i1.p1  ORF type:complete len:1763 (-),score=337.97 TRINITY_DN91784_c0_g1_i1:482-5770(-)